MAIMENKMKKKQKQRATSAGDDEKKREPRAGEAQQCRCYGTQDGSFSKN